MSHLQKKRIDFCAIIRNNKNIIEVGVKVIMCDILKAVENSCKEEVRSLIENGADVNAENQDRCTSLHLAAEKGNVEIIELLIRQNTKINAQDKDGSTPLHKAVQCMNIVEQFIKNTVNLFHAQDKNMPSHNDNHIDAVRVLLQAKGIDINLADKNGCTPLYLAVVYGCVDIVKVLSQAKGIDVNAANEDGQTPLHLAALLGCIGIVKALLQAKGIDANARDKNGCTPLLLRLSTQYIPDIAKA